MWADIDTKQDFLNYGEAAVLVADIIRDERMLPTSIGIMGSWGTGKSSLLNIVESELRKDPATEDAIIVRFDAWLYQGYDDAKAALMETVSDALIAAAENAEDKSLLGRAKELGGRVRWFRAAGTGVELAAAALGFPLLGAARVAAAAGERLFEGDGTEDDVGKVRAGVKEVKDAATGLIAEKEERTPPKGWYGSLILHEHDKSTLGILQRVVGERVGAKPPPWLVAANKIVNLGGPGSARGR